MIEKLIKYKSFGYVFDNVEEAEIFDHVSEEANKLLIPFWETLHNTEFMNRGGVIKIHQDYFNNMVVSFNYILYKLGMFDYVDSPRYLHENLKGPVNKLYRVLYALSRQVGEYYIVVGQPYFADKYDKLESTKCILEIK